MKILFFCYGLRDYVSWQGTDREETGKEVLAYLYVKGYCCNARHPILFGRMPDGSEDCFLFL